jgi:hypothetical protein
VGERVLKRMRAQCVCWLSVSGKGKDPANEAPRGHNHINSTHHPDTTTNSRIIRFQPLSWTQNNP